MNEQRGFWEQVWFVFSKPANLGCYEERVRLISGPIHDRLRTKLFGQRLRLRKSSAVHPDESGPNWQTLAVEQNQRRRLRAHRQAEQTRLCTRHLFQNASDGAARGRPPVFRVLLYPSRLKIVRRVSSV